MARGLHALGQPLNWGRGVACSCPHFCKFQHVEFFQHLSLPPHFSSNFNTSVEKDNQHTIVNGLTMYVPANGAMLSEPYLSLQAYKIMEQMVTLVLDSATCCHIGP